jgi:hypothetical protein
VFNTREGRCGLGEFDCLPESVMPFCLPFEVVRDCIVDCPNGADESMLKRYK